MTVKAMFPKADIDSGMYESFYLRAVAPDEPLGAWIRYTVHKHPGQTPRGSLWCTVFDASVGAPFMQKYTSEDLTVPAGEWIAIGDSCLGAQRAVGQIAIDQQPHALAETSTTHSDRPRETEPPSREVRWSLRISSDESELRHLEKNWLYRAPLPRTKLTSPMPAASFDGTIELPGRTLDVRGWRGMVGHNWGSEHAERWIWLHGIGFQEDPSAWVDVALGRVLVAGRLTPWLASGAISVKGRRLRLGGLGARGLKVLERPTRCTLTLPGESGLVVHAHVDTPPTSAAGWRYADPAHGHEGRGSEHDVVNCSVAALALNVHPRGEPATILRTDHGAAYELGMREHNHGVTLAPFSDG